MMSKINIVEVSDAQNTDTYSDKVSELLDTHAACI